MRGVVGAIAASALLFGCQTAEQQAEDPIGWGRIDCQRIVPGTEIATQFEQAKLVCVNRAEAAGVAGTAAMPTGYGLGGAIASGISAGIASAQIQTATAKSCMAEYGYMMGRKSEFEGRCAVASPPPVPSASTAPSGKTKGKKPAVAATAPPRPAVTTAAPMPIVEAEPVLSERDRDLMNLQR